MKSLRSMLALRTNCRASESLVPNKRAPSADAPHDFLPRRQVVLRRRTERVPDSDQGGLTLRAYWSVIQRLVTIADSPMRRPLEDLPAGEANECRCQLLFHARSGAELCFCDGQSFIQDRAFHVPFGCKLLITSLIRVFLQPSGSYIHSRNLPVSLCVSCALSMTLAQ